MSHNHEQSARQWQEIGAVNFFRVLMRSDILSDQAKHEVTKEFLEQHGYYNRRHVLVNPATYLQMEQ